MHESLRIGCSEDPYVFTTSFLMEMSENCLSLMKSAVWIFVYVQHCVRVINGLPGRFDLLLENAGIASMHTAVTHYNTVVFLDRTNVGLSEINLTNGICRDNPADRVATHDCSAHSVLYDLSTNAVRPLFVFTDTWCSSGSFMPNGTLMQTGGDFDGYQKIRYFSPCPSTGSCDWVESEETLLSGRWYATNQLLPDLRIISLGGRGAFSYEFLPDQGLGLFDLPFLRDTNDEYNDNLYPFVHLLPDHNLFVFANRDSILLNFYSNTIVRSYPRIPGEPRNYPCAGSSVLLPLDSANGFSLAEVMICGGSNKYAFGYPSWQPSASQTCGRMVVSSPSPSWIMQTMPLPRNMGDMLLLPDDRVLIINGAQNGSQGWMDATIPCLSPLLYDPLTSRFELQAPSAIARVYHSTANLLPDGRILLAGSNTHQFYTPTGQFPTELRVEAFSPAYLDVRYASQRPSIVQSPPGVRYGVNFSVEVAVAGRVRSEGIKLNLMSAPYTTHSFSQGQRQLKLAVSAPARIGSSRVFVVESVVPAAVLAPPTYYMLFAVNGGIPSTAAWVLVSY